MIQEVINMIPIIDVKATGVNMRRLMDERNITVKDIARELNLGSLYAIYKWLQGRGLPSVDNLVGLSHVLQVSMEDILVLEERG